MTTLALILKEIFHRKAQSLLSLLAVLVASALFVGLVALGKAAEADTRERMRATGYNLRVLPPGADRAEVRDGVLGALDRALEDHELVKVRLREPEDKKAAANELADRSGSELCGLVGHTVILYRPHPERPRIELPTRDDA